GDHQVGGADRAPGTTVSERAVHENESRTGSRFDELRRPGPERGQASASAATSWPADTGAEIRSSHPEASPIEAAYWARRRATRPSPGSASSSVYWASMPWRS